MKITTSGTLTFANGDLVIYGWAYDAEGITYESSDELNKALVEATLLYIGKTASKSLSSDDQTHRTGD